MPKPRTARREKRSLARQIATADARAVLTELAENPPSALPDDDARAAYRAQINHHIAKLSRAHAHTPPLALADRPASPGADEPS